MVISIEPQIYHPELGLVQIEDQFAVRGGGGAMLTDLPREILEC
jgi:Xaa-Pro aminopeptidase